MMLKFRIGKVLKVMSVAFSERRLYAHVRTGIIICSLCSFSIVYGQEKISLQQAVDAALKNNLQLKQTKLNESLSEQNLKESKLALFPTLNTNSNLNFNFGRSVDPFSYQFVNQQITSVNGSVFSSVTLFQGGQKLNQISRNKYLLESDKSNIQKARNDLSLNVVTTYLTILNNSDLVTASQQQLDIAKQQFDRLQKQFNVGDKTVADISQAKSQVATAELNLTNAQNQLDLSYLDLAQLMERDPQDKFVIEKPEIDEIGQLNTVYSATEVYTHALKTYPDIKVAEYNRLAAKEAVDISKGSLYPRLDLQGSLATGYSSTSQRVVGVDDNGDPVIKSSSFNDQLNQNFNQTIGFGLSIPIFNGYSARIGVRRAKISYQNAILAEDVAKDNLNKVINQAVLDVRAAERSYYSAQTAYESSKNAFNAIEQRYNVGLVNSLDYNQSQTNLNQAQFNLIQAKYELIFRSKLIDFYLGNPLTF